MTSEQLKAARALLRWTQEDLAKASGVPLPTLRRIEAKPGPLSGYARTADALRAAIVAAGVVLISENEVSSGGLGVRLQASE